MRFLFLMFVLLMAACTAREQATPPDASAADRGSDELWRGVDFSCRSDTDCTIKNLGNCCGYYPACVNIDSPTFPGRVRAECEAQGMSSVCGFPELTGCVCVAGRCEGVSNGGGRLD